MEGTRDRCALTAHMMAAATASLKVMSGTSAGSSFHKYMLLAGWEVRIGKNCDRGHSFSLYGPILSRTMTCLSFFLRQIGLQVGLFTQLCIELAYAPCTNQS